MIIGAPILRCTASARSIFKGAFLSSLEQEEEIWYPSVGLDMTSTRKNLGPLTTPFTYPSSCAIPVLDCSTCSGGWQAQTCSNNKNSNQGAQDDAECWPPASSSDLLTGTGFLGGGFYSPGISCPVGYVSACSATGTETQGFQFQYPLLKAETGIGCCPSGFSCARSKVSNGIAQTCYRIYSTDGFSAATCSLGYRLEKSQDVPYTVLATRTNSETSSETTTATGADTTNADVRTVWLVINRMTVNAPLIQLIHKRTDLPASTATATSTGADTTTDATSSDSNSTSSLSVGAKAGIGIGAAAGGLILIGAIIFFLLQRRKRTAQLSPQDKNRPRELPPNTYKAELPGQTVPFEMDASKERVPPVEIGSSK